MPYSDPKRAEEYWAYCVANDVKCQRLAECLKASRCLSGRPYPVSYPNPSCQAYDYCPKREACLAAARCLDIRAGPPRRAPAAPRASDPINHPSHYTSHPSGVECIEVVRHLNFNRGNAIKYIWRAGAKGGSETLLEDLKKARWYLDDEIKRLEAPDGKVEG